MVIRKLVKFQKDPIKQSEELYSHDFAMIRLICKNRFAWVDGKRLTVKYKSEFRIIKITQKINQQIIFTFTSLIC